MADILQVENLIKTFGAVRAVDGVSFRVRRGELFAFLGQNGAGKSTTIGVLIGLLKADGGSVVYGAGEEFSRFKSKTGVVFQNNILDDNLTVEENIVSFGRLYLKERRWAERRAAELIALFNLEEVKKQFYKNLSGGQKRKTEIAAALVNEPVLLFLDEPTTGLDPKTRKEVWEILRAIREKNALTVFLTTHYMEETAETDNIVIIHKGKKICEGTPAELKARYTCDSLFAVPLDADKLEKRLQADNFAYAKTADTYKIKITDTKASIALLYACRDNIKFYEVVKGNMDDVFLNAVGSSGGAEGE